MMNEDISIPNADKEVSFAERFASLEHQCYLMYLQLNAISQLLVNGGTLSKKDIGKIMDGMHHEIEEALQKPKPDISITSEDVVN